MPTSIIEDSARLTSTGRIFCILLFFIGVILLATAMSQIGKGVEILKTQGARERVSSIADSIPEEMSFALPPVTQPKTKEELIIRSGETEGLLNMLSEQAKKDPYFKLQPESLEDSKKIVALGVTKGLIHPKEGQRILQEVAILGLEIDAQGQWQSTKNKKRETENQQLTNEQP